MQLREGKVVVMEGSQSMEDQEVEVALADWEVEVALVSAGSLIVEVELQELLQAGRKP